MKRKTVEKRYKALSTLTSPGTLQAQRESESKIRDTQNYSNARTIAQDIGMSLVIDTRTKKMHKPTLGRFGRKQE